MNDRDADEPRSKGAGPRFSNRPKSFVWRKIYAPEPLFQDLKIYRRVFLPFGVRTVITMAI